VSVSSKPRLKGPPGADHHSRRGPNPRRRCRDRAALPLPEPRGQHWRQRCGTQEQGPPVEAPSGDPPADTTGGRAETGKLATRAHADQAAPLEGPASSGGARIRHRLLRARLDRGRPEPCWRSLVGRMSRTFPRARPTHDVALCHRPVVFGREHRRRARRRRRRAASARSFRCGPGLVAPPPAVGDRPAKSLGLSRPSPGRSSEPRSPFCHQVWGPLPRNGDRLGQ
jgi:hypothetical protein